METKSPKSKPKKVMRKTDAQRLLERKLVQDCVIYRFTENEALQYIKIYSGDNLEMKRSKYFDIKKKLESDEELQLWLKEHMAVGIIKDHKDHHQLLHKMLEDNVKMYFTEKSIPAKIDQEGQSMNNPEYNFNKIRILQKEIREIIAEIGEVGLANPIVAAIKQEILAGMKNEK